MSSNYLHYDNRVNGHFCETPEVESAVRQYIHDAYTSKQPCVTPKEVCRWDAGGMVSMNLKGHCVDVEETVTFADFIELRIQHFGHFVKVVENAETHPKYGYWRIGDWSNIFVFTNETLEKIKKEIAEQQNVLDFKAAAIMEEIIGRLSGCKHVVITKGE